MPNILVIVATDSPVSRMRPSHPRLFARERLRSAGLLTTRLRRLASNNCAFMDQLSLEFCERREHASGHAAGGRRGIDAFPEGADVDATLAGCVEGVDRVDKGAAQSIEGWHEEGVAFADVVESSSETGTIRVSAGHDVVEDAVHAGGLECVVLSVEGLVSGADAGVPDEVSGAGHCAHNPDSLTSWRIEQR